MQKFLVLTVTAVLAVACKKEAETYTVQQRPLNEAVYASGEIMPADYYFLRTTSSDRLLKILVKEGDQVKQGDLLAVLGTPSESEQRDILANQVTLAARNARRNSATLTQLESSIAFAREKYHQDSVTATRYRDLAREGAVSEREAAHTALQAESSRTEYENALQQYHVQQNELTGRLLNARQQQAVLQQSREGKLFTSPLNGKVLAINYEEADVVPAHEPVLLVGVTDQFKLELLVDERDIRKVKRGQKVYFETDAFAGRQFEATILRIGTVLAKDTRSFKVEAVVTPGEAFYPQSSVEANILIQENAKALMIPSRFLLPGDSVQVRQGDAGQKVKIATGICNGDWVEVKSGLKPGDVLLKNT